MTDLVKAVDPWFLNMSVVGLAVYFLWSIKGLFRDLKESILELKSLIQDLYNHRNDHENRLVALETRCKYQHGDVDAVRQGTGRRLAD